MRPPILTLALSPVLALTLAGAAHAENWQWYKIAGGAVAFDADSRVKDEATMVAAANTLVYYDEAREASAGNFHFMAERLEFECNTTRYRWAHSAVYDRDGGFITARADGPWLELEQQTGSAGFFRLVMCGDVPENPTGEAASLQDLVASIRDAAPGPALAATPPAAAPAPAVSSPVATASAAASSASPPPAAPAAPAPTTSTFDFDALAASLAGDAD